MPETLRYCVTEKSTYHDLLYTVVVVVTAKMQHIRLVEVILHK